MIVLLTSKVKGAKPEPKGISERLEQTIDRIDCIILPHQGKRELLIFFARETTITDMTAFGTYVTVFLRHPESKTCYLASHLFYMEKTIIPQSKQLLMRIPKEKMDMERLVQLDNPPMLRVGDILAFKVHLRPVREIVVR